MSVTGKRWQLKPLGEIFDTSSGGTPSRGQKEFYKGNIAWLKSGELNDNQCIEDSGEHITSEAIQNSSAKLFPIGTVLIAMYGATTGKIGILKKESSTNQAVCGIFPHEKYYPNIVFYYLLFRRQSLIDQAKGGAQPNINQGIIKQLLFPEISSKEQQEVLNIIETQLTRLDASVKALQSVKKKLELYRKSVLKSAFCGESKKLSEIVKKDKHALKRGPFGGSLKKEIFVKNSEYLVYEQRHAIHNDFDYKKYYITKKKYNEMIMFNVVPRDLIISCSGVTLGKISEIPENAQPGIINQALLKVSLDSTIVLNKYFIHLFQSELMQRHIRSLSRGAAIPNLPSVKNMKEIAFPIPSIEKQQQIVLEIESRFSVIDKIEETVNHALVKAERLRKSILKSAFEGRLVKEV